ncbi:phage tail protein [Paenibacillus sp. GCM10012303]|uniref:phage tail protein n=1 Tax=Paenibacillus sp. GCM10012303 TaxID=3317340 RepID=UPI0036102B79
MAEPFLAEIRLFSFAFPPKGWALCNGQFLPINQNQALFSLLGTTYGGDGQTTFALPDLRGRVPGHSGNGIVLGQRGGEENHMLTMSEMPGHQHLLRASSLPASSRSPQEAQGIGQVWAAPGVSAYHTWGPQSGAVAATSPQTTSVAGGTSAHSNMQPYLTLSFCMAIQGIFPSPN